MGGGPLYRNDGGGGDDRETRMGLLSQDKTKVRSSETDHLSLFHPRKDAAPCKIRRSPYNLFPIMYSIRGFSTSTDTAGPPTPQPEVTQTARPNRMAATGGHLIYPPAVFDGLR